MVVDQTTTTNSNLSLVSSTVSIACASQKRLKSGIKFLIFSFCWFFSNGYKGEKRTMALPPIRLKLKKPKSKKKVAFSADTVDNENMNKKKSKCCCIYEKPRDFGESSSESDDDECEHCKGHVERKRTKAHHSSTEESYMDPIEDPNK